MGGAEAIGTISEKGNEDNLSLSLCGAGGGSY